MKIVVAANDSQWNEWMSIPEKSECIRVPNASSFSKEHDADAYFNLHDDAHQFNYQSFQKPVFINAVSYTLLQLDAPTNIFRINGWAGFLERPAWEIAGKFCESVNPVFESLNKKMIPVQDEPGLIAARIISMIINEAYFALEDNVSSKQDIDTAMKLGTNYPYGPFEWASMIGCGNILFLLQQLHLSDDRYRPSALLISESTL